MRYSFIILLNDIGKLKNKLNAIKILKDAELNSFFFIRFTPESSVFNIESSIIRILKATAYRECAISIAVLGNHKRSAAVLGKPSLCSFENIIIVSTKRFSRFYVMCRSSTHDIPHFQTSCPSHLQIQYNIFIPICQAFFNKKLHKDNIVFLCSMYINIIYIKVQRYD